MTAIQSLARTELRLFLREPVAVAWGVVFPPVLLTILGSIPSFREPDNELNGARVIDLYVPITVVLVLAMLAISALPVTLSTYREKGILRRLSTTPASPAALLVAQLMIFAAVCVVTMLILLGVGRIVFDVSLPKQPVGFLLAYLLSLAGVLSIGVFVAATAPSAKVANGVGMLLFFPMMFFAGLWVPRDAMPNALRSIGDYTPLGAAAQAIQDASAGDWPRLLNLLVLLGYAAIATFGAVRVFRWE